MESELQHLREWARRPREPLDRQGHRAQSQCHNVKELQHAERLPLRLQDLHGNEERTVCDVGLRRTESSAAHLHVPETLLQRREQVLFPTTSRRRALMNGFELILPFLRPIQHLILDPEISEIMVNGSECVFIERRGYVEQVQGVSLGPKSLEVAVKNIARRLGDDISEEKPILDSRLPDGSRVAAVLPPCSIDGITLTIRKFNTRHFTMADLIEHRTLSQETATLLREKVGNRQNILISGGTGTGKTTLLNILANFIPDDERILVIEDTAEIQISAPNLVRFEARVSQDHCPAVTIRELL